MCAARQKEILENAVKNVAIGGYLLYSTCTYSTEENEEIVADFLDSHLDFSLRKCDEGVESNTSNGVDITDGKRPELSYCRRFYPHICAGEGQFVALLKRDGEAENFGNLVKDSFACPSKNDCAAAKAFMEETVGDTLGELCVLGGNIALFDNSLTNSIPLPPFGVVSAGVTLGECRKGRIVPYHHYFTAFGNRFLSKACLSPDDEAVLRYISGEEIEIPAELRGYTALLLRVGESEITLGGGKAVGGRLKNYYPKGLRQLNLYR